MKIMVYADPHWSAYSSIVRSRGDKYSVRLENLIQSLNWVEGTASKYGCEQIVCLGDFFDKAELNSEEITALQEIEWADIHHTFIVGNHEMGRSNLQFSSAHLFLMPSQFNVVDDASVYHTTGAELWYVPYILESDRKPLKDYVGEKTDFRIIFSHNDIKGIQMGKFESTEGFSVEEIEDSCDIFVNGHIHNTSHIGRKIINLGNLTGQNFGEDANLYRHYAILIDTDTHKIEWLENPYAFNFYKLNLVNYEPLTDTDMTIPDIFKYGITGNAVVTVKIDLGREDYIRDIINSSPNIVEHRVIVEVTSDKTVTESANSVNCNVDHLSQFVDYIKNELGTSNEILEELDKVVVG